MRGLDEGELLAYRLQCVRVGVETTGVVLPILALWALLTPEALTSPTGFWTVMVVAGLGAAGVAVLPWRRLFERGLGMSFLYAWSVADIVLIGAGIVFSGGEDSAFYLVFTLTTVFFAASYPVGGQVALFAFTAVTYVAAVLLSGADAAVEAIFIHLGVLGAVAFMASFLSRHLMEQMTANSVARAESERRSTVLAVVAGAAREMSTLDPDLLLKSVVRSATEVGFEAAEICAYEETSGTWIQTHAEGIFVAGYRKTAPISDGLAGQVWVERRTSVVADYSTWDGGLAPVRADGWSTMVASPVWCGGELVAVLIAGSREQRAVDAHEVEAIELLASQAGAALTLARRYADRQEFEVELQHQATHDPQTGLPNRTLLFDRIDHGLAAATRDDQPTGVLFVDLDRFRPVNDSLGHEAGDRLLAALADRLRTCVRPGDTLARYGGDEFVVVVERVGHAEVVRLAERLLAAVRRPFPLSGRQVMVTASIGITLAGGSREHQDVLREADLAMVRAKQLGGDRWEVFSPGMGTDAIQRLDRETELRRAIEEGELRLVYQPVVALSTGRIDRVEALVRWDHPTRGTVGPGEFIPLAEETGLVVPLGQWVATEACRQAAAWLAAGTDIAVAVNLSPVQFQHPYLATDLASAIAASGCGPSRLVVEITESAMLADPDGAIAVMRDLDALGVALVLDDFGQGFSSLSYLKRLPLSTVKIDRSFVSGLADSPDDQAIVRAVVSLARDLSMTVTAEGVETLDQLAEVRRLGCDHVQGFVFAPGIPADEIPALVRRPVPYASGGRVVSG